MRAPFQFGSYLALVWLIGGWPLWAAAQQQSQALTVESARVGVGGVSKAGFWTPIWLELKAGDLDATGALEIVIPDGDNVPVIYGGDNNKIALQPNERATILHYAKMGRENATVHVRLKHGEQIVWSQELTGLPARLAATQELIVGIGDDVKLKEAIAGSRRSPEHSQVVAQTTSAAELPDRWLGYEGVDQIVLVVGHGKHVESLSPAQRDALLLWLRLGGRMVVSVGSGGEWMAAAGSPWHELLPGQLLEVSPLRDRAGLEVFTGVELPWEDDEFQRTRPLVTRLTQSDGVVLADEVGSGGERPLVVRSAQGLGEVVFIGLDLAHPGFAKWAGRPKLLATVLGSSQSHRDDDAGEKRRGIAHLGYDDLVGQLRAALDQFPGVALVSFTTVSVLTAAFLLLIGPGDFLLLSRLNIPRQVTWFTFALVALLFAGTAWWLGRATHGDSVRVNQLEIVDIEATQGIVRGTGWAHVYSPHAARFSLETVSPDKANWATAVEGVLAWQGLPGDSIGGLASRQRSLVTTEPYHVLAAGRSPGIHGLPVHSASSKSLALRCWGTTSTRPVSSLVRNSYGALAGEVANPLPFELSDCLVAFEDKLYRLGKLSPGKGVELGDRSPLNLEARITQKSVEGAREIRALWKRDSTDVPRIVQMLMFHEVATGRNYTGLTHRYQPYLDLSSHLRLNRAVLVGRAGEPVTRLVQNDGEPLAATAETSSETWFRIVYPVSTNPMAASTP